MAAVLSKRGLFTAGAVAAALAVACKNSIQGTAPGGNTPRGPVAPAVLTAAPLVDTSQFRTLTSLSATLLKARAAESSQLQANEKCDVASGFALQIVGAPTPVADKHFRVTLGPSNALPGCALLLTGNASNTGSLGNAGGSVYIYGPHFGVEGVAPGTKEADTSKTPLSDFIAIMVGGLDTTSEWCVERGVGTCPHIGVDLVGKPAEGLTKSYAMSNGIVERIVDVGECGWRIDFRDSAGALWGYLHRKKPGFQKGQRLYRGELVGIWYGGDSSCVTGPHLHLERFEAGAHGGSKKGFTCSSRNQGYRNCNFDPLAPLKSKRVVKSESEMASLAQASKSAGAGSSLSLSLDGTAPGPSLIPLQFECNASQPAPVAGVGINMNHAESTGLSVRVRARDYGTEDLVVSVSASLNEMKNNTLPTPNAPIISNVCGENGEQECVEAWELHVRASDGTWHRHFADQGMRNRALFLPFERDYCVKKAFTPEVRVVVLTSHDRVLVANSTLEKVPVDTP